MNPALRPPRPHQLPPRPRLLAGCVVATAVFCWATISRAQDAPPDPISSGTPVASPTPDPTATPGGSPAPAGPPDFSDPAVVAAYNAARTPQVNVAVAATAPSSTNAASGPLARQVAAAQTAAQRIQPFVQNGLGTLVQLPAAARAKPSSFGTSSTNGSATSNPQPVVTVLLTYSPLCVGQLVWVQMLQGGTLTAAAGAGHTYDGTNGFFLTLDANGMATFNYQAPNASGTYRVFTRFSNVPTTLPFLVPDSTP